MLSGVQLAASHNQPFQPLVVVAADPLALVLILAAQQSIKSVFSMCYATLGWCYYILQALHSSGLALSIGNSQVNVTYNCRAFMRLDPVKTLCLKSFLFNNFAVSFRCERLHQEEVVERCRTHCTS